MSYLWVFLSMWLTNLCSYLNNYICFLPSVTNIMLTIFWDTKGPIPIYFLEIRMFNYYQSFLLPTVASFSKKWIEMCYFISQKAVSIIFFTDDCATQKKVFPETSVFPLHRLSFSIGVRCDKAMFNHSWIFLRKQTTHHTSLLFCV